MRSSRFVIILLLSFFAYQGSSWTQSATASILGQVTDQQGAGIPGAKITVTNVATQVVSRTESDAEGNYRVLALPIGTYRVSAEHPGFARLVTEPRTLQINQQERMDLHLVVGARSETVEVTGVGTNVETVNPTLGQSITSRPIVNLPLNGRNVLQLALLQPGVTDDNPDDESATQGFNVAGGRTDSVTYLLDGGLNNELLGNGVVYNPNPDAVAEFRILTSNYTAEYGRNGAGVISVVTKSGTNHIHGSAFDFLRNTDFDANSYFNIQDGLPRNDLKRNQFGGTIGGPITIPHLIEGKDRFFFFVAYQGQRQTQAVVQSGIPTFTPAELKGDFSQAIAYNGTTCLNSSGCPEPNVAAFLAANPYFTTPNGNAAQAIIDPTKIDPAAQNYIGLGLIPTSPIGVTSSQGSSTNNSNELTIKFDFNLTSKDKVSTTLGGFRNPQLQPYGFNGANVLGFPSNDRTNNYFLNLAYTRTFSTTLLNEARFTTQRHNFLGDLPAATLPTSAALGFGIASDLPNGPPLLNFDTGMNVGFSPQGPRYEIGNTFAFTDALTWVRGRSTWKFGAGISAYQNNTIYDFYGDGNYFFLGPYDQGGIGTGNSFADFLVGIPNYIFEGPNAANNIRSKAVYGFAQDEWRAGKRLVLTLGIRYEYSQPKLDTEGRTFSIIPGDQSTRFPNAPLGLVFPGDPGAPSGVNFPDKTNFAPRIGFAWSPGNDNKTSIRGGFGIFYDVLKGEDNLQFNGAPPFYSEPTAAFLCPPQNVSPSTGFCTAGSASNPGYPSATTYYSAPWPTAGFSSNPFPSPGPNPTTAFNTCAPGYSCPYYNFLPFGGYESGLYFVNPHLKTPYTFQYNLSLQRELARNLVAELNYVGSSSKGLTSLQDINPFDLSTINTTSPARILNEQTFNANYTGYCAAIGPSECPFGGAELEFRNIAFASFNSLEASLTKQNGENRYIGNTYFTLGYTYGHSIDDASGFRNRDSQVPYYDPGVFRASSDFDVANRITFSGGWDLPFDKAWGSGPKRLVKGWSLYPIFSWRTGFPLSINAGISGAENYPGPSGAGDAYLANAVFAPGFSSISILNPKTNGNFYFNPAAFTCLNTTTTPPSPEPCVPTSGYGLPRDFFRGPGRTNLDVALAKTTSITERLNFEFRAEAFNVFNHTEFANPITNVSDIGSTFGEITTTDLGNSANPATLIHTERILQVAGRLTF